MRTAPRMLGFIRTRDFGQILFAVPSQTKKAADVAAFSHSGCGADTALSCRRRRAR